MRLCLLCVFIFACVHLNAQYFHPFFYIDTVKSTDRIGGDLDSIDLIVGVHSSTFPGGGFNLNENIFRPTDFLKFPGGQQFYSFKDWKPVRFSGIPHIGFAYSFGGNGTQYVQANYQQVFAKSYLLNLDFTKYRSNGFLRNGEFSHNDVQLQLQKKGKFYSFQLKGSYESSDVSQNGGLLVDTLANDFPLIFLPVRKDSANTFTQRIRVFQSNFFDFNKDSLIDFGMFTEHELSIKKYNYSEQDTLGGIYSMINFDSLITKDQHQLSQVLNGVGIYYKTKNQFFKAGANLKFWNFQNLGIYRDTVEIGINGLYHYSGNKMKISDDLEFNIVGAGNQFSNKLKILYVENGWHFSGKWNLENNLPDYYQRYSQGNNYTTNLTDPQLQMRSNVNLSVNKKFGSIDVIGTYSNTILKNNYFFIDTTWRNDTLNNLNFNQFVLRFAYTYKALHVQPEYAFTLSSAGFQIIPEHRIQTRIFVKGGLFKARKMKAYVGIDFALLSAYQRVGYNSNVSCFDFNEITPVLVGFSNLHFFTGFQIEEFKFFLRVENLGYFWNDRNLELMNGYPIPSNQFRLGITWDFFN